MSNKRIRKPRTTLSMRIAKSHDSSKQLNGWILAAGYKIAITLAVIEMIVGLVMGYNKTHPSTDIGNLIITWGVIPPIAVVLSILAENLSLASIKRAKIVGWCLQVLPHILGIGLGVFFSVISGEQLFSLMFTGDDAWKAWAYAYVVCAILNLTEIYCQPHEDSLGESIQRSPLSDIAEQEEVKEQLFTRRRELRLSLFNEPQFIDQLREQERVNLIEMSKADQAARLQRVQIVESDVTHVQQLAGPLSEQKLLPEHVQLPVAQNAIHHVELVPYALPKTETTADAFQITDKYRLAQKALQENPQISDAELAQIIGSKTPSAARFWRLKVAESTPEIVHSIRSNSEQNTTIDVPENVQSANNFEPASEQPDVQHSEHITDPLPELPENNFCTEPLPEVDQNPVQENEQNTDPIPVQKSAKKQTRNVTKKVAGLDPKMVKKILNAEAKLTKEGKKITQTAIGEIIGERRQLVATYQKAMTAEEA